MPKQKSITTIKPRIKTIHIKPNNLNLQYVFITIKYFTMNKFINIHIPNILLLSVYNAGNLVNNASTEPSRCAFKKDNIHLKLNFEYNY